jgi:hypothetical protein
MMGHLKHFEVCREQRVYFSRGMFLVSLKDSWRYIKISRT